LKTHNCAGIYLVYSGIQKFEESQEKCLLQEILYIGESNNLAERFELKSKSYPQQGLKHEKYSEWKRQLNINELLYFSF
jgi:hypothetical protein